jgi:Tol biopolymer transport system component
VKFRALLAAGCIAAALFAASGSSRTLGFSYTSPSWSPDGRELVFGSARGPNGNLLIAHANGTHLRRVLRAQILSQVVWSPDGTRVAFVARGRVFVVGRDGRGLRRIARGAAVAWSPDSRRLAFDSGWAGPIRVAEATGGVRAVTSGRYDRAPSWSPSGGELVFSRTETPGGTESLYAVSADGTNLRALGIQGADAAWAPGGDKVAYWRKTSTGVGLAVAGLDGSSPIMITRSLPAYSGPARWSPDGTRLLFSPCSGPGFCRVDVADAEGREVTILSAGAEPSWAPNGVRIAFTARRACRTSSIFAIDADGKRLARVTPCR